LRRRFHESDWFDEGNKLLVVAFRTPHRALGTLVYCCFDDSLLYEGWANVMLRV